jgi:hypothetical protein
MSIAYLYDHHPLADSTGCIALWRSVIYRALQDSCYQFFDDFMMQKHSLVAAWPQYISPENWRHAQDARRFLLADERGFLNVCVCADIDPGYLRRRARRVINDVDLMVKAVPPAVVRAKPYRSMRMTA